MWTNAAGAAAVETAGELLRIVEADTGLGCIVALRHHPSTLYQIREHIRCLYV